MNGITGPKETVAIAIVIEKRGKAEVLGWTEALGLAVAIGVWGAQSQIAVAIAVSVNVVVEIPLSAVVIRMVESASDRVNVVSTLKKAAAARNFKLNSAQLEIN